MRCTNGEVISASSLGELEKEMEGINSFELIKEENISEFNSKARIYRHKKTCAQILSIMNDDENKVFAVTLRTPPKDSAGVAHILEHSVLCGSRKYPVKEPFVELLKGSLQTFLNAFTYPDKTCYPVASQNLRDFYNLIDVYLDAVFYPRITPFIFQQEGWHLELEDPDQPLSYKGVVFNEMKGAYSSPDRLIMEYSQQSLFPDTCYGLESGGDPKQIPDLTYEAFRAFHQDYYHPSNARFFFYGDDDPDERLKIIDGYLNDFEKKRIDSAVPLQKPFNRPRSLVKFFAGGEAEDDRSKGMTTVNWLLSETTPPETNLALQTLEYILLGMPSSPLRMALIKSGLGEDIAGAGLEDELRQIYFSTGLKGIDPEDTERIEYLILDTLSGLVSDGIDPLTVEAALNTVEFQLRENNTGGFPRGLVMMLRALTTWLYDEDPLALLAFNRPLANIKTRVNSGERFFESLIDRLLINNPHRTTLTLKSDPRLGERDQEEERGRLSQVRAEMSYADISNIIENAKRLRDLQETPDPPEALATIPFLKLEDIEKENKLIPLDVLREEGTQVLYHDIETNGILYLDVGFDLHCMPQQYLRYVPLFGRALLEMGTQREDYVRLTQRISRETGGIHPRTVTSTAKDSTESVVQLMLSGKAMLPKAGELLNILSDVFFEPRFNDQERFRQMVLEEKARQEHSIVPEGHNVVNLRLRAHFNEADWVAEEMRGVNYLFFLRELATAVDDDWSSVLKILEKIRSLLVNRKGMLLNVTLDGEGWSNIRPRVREFLTRFPEAPVEKQCWQPTEMPRFEGLVVPSQVNYVGKGANLYRRGYRFHGSTLVISHYLRTAWLWDKIRVQGGAYSASSIFDRFSGTFTFVSYRDPNLEKTLDVYDETADYLRNIDLSDEELTKSIIGVIGTIDQHMLPDAKGYISLLRYMSRDDDAGRQRMREEVLSTTVAHFRNFGEALGGLRREGLVAVLGSQGALEESAALGGERLEITKLL